MAISDIISALKSRARIWNRPSWWNLLVALPWAIGLIFLLFSSKGDRAIADRQQTTYAIVKTYEPANHGRYGYEFFVYGKLYTGWQIPSSKVFKIGQQVLVYYDPLDPTKNSLNNFSEATEQILGPVLFCVLGITAVTVFIFFRRRTLDSWHR